MASSFTRERRAAVGALVSRLVASVRDSEDDDDGESAHLTRKLVENIYGSSGGGGGASKRRFRFVEEDNVDERGVAREFEALMEKLRIFGQDEKARRMEELVRALLMQPNVTTKKTLGATSTSAARHALLALLMALSGQPLYTVVRGFVYEEESSETMQPEGGRDAGDRAGSLSDADLGVTGFDDDNSNDDDDGFLSEGSGCSEGRWMSSESDASTSDDEHDDDDTGRAGATRVESCQADGYSAGVDDDPRREEEDAVVVRSRERRRGGEEDEGAVRDHEARIVAAELIARDAGRFGDNGSDAEARNRLATSRGPVDEPLLVRKLMLMVNGFDDSLLSKKMANCKAERVWTSSLSHAAIANLLADEARVSETVRWLESTLTKCLDAAAVLDGRSSPTLQAFARSIESRLRRAMDASRRLDVAAREAELDPLCRCPTLLECHIQLKESVHAISFLKMLVERVLASFDARVLDERTDIEACEPGLLACVAASVLDALYHLVDELYLDSDTRKHEECVRILAETIVPYARWTQLWLDEGEIGHAEFMITRIPAAVSSDWRDCIPHLQPVSDMSVGGGVGVTPADSYLGKEYELRRDVGGDFADAATSMPAFLRPDAHEILVAGRCRRLLKMRATSHVSHEWSRRDLGDAFKERLHVLCCGSAKPCHRVVDDEDGTSRVVVHDAEDEYDDDDDNDDEPVHGDVSRASMSTHRDGLVDLAKLSILGDFCRSRLAMQDAWESVGMAKVHGVVDVCDSCIESAPTARTKGAALAPMTRGSCERRGVGDDDNDDEKATEVTASTEMEANDDARVWRPMTSDILIDECLMLAVRTRCLGVSSDFLRCLLGPWGLRRALQSLRDLFLMGKGELLHAFVTSLYSKIEDGEVIGDAQDVNDALHESLMVPEFADSMELLQDVAVVRVATPQPAADASASSPAQPDVSPAPSHWSTPGWSRVRHAPPSPSPVDGIKLTCSVRWPLGLVVDESSLSVYGDCFIFLLKLRGSIFLLDQIHHRLSQKRAAPSTSLTRVSIELRHFVVNLHRYVMESVVRREGDVLERALDAASSAADVRKCHRRFIRHIARYCMISKDQLWAILRVKVSHILSLVPTLVGVVRSCAARGWPRCEEADDTVHKLSRDFARLMNSVMQILHRQAEVTSTSSLSMSLLLFLDFNEYWRKQM